MTDDVIISGTNWRPEVHGAEYYHKEIMKLLDNPNVTDRAVKTGLWLMRSQIFKDGNKRIGSFAINKIWARLSPKSIARGLPFLGTFSSQVFKSLS